MLINEVLLFLDEKMKKIDKLEDASKWMTINDLNFQLNQLKTGLNQFRKTVSDVCGEARNQHRDLTEEENRYIARLFNTHIKDQLRVLMSYLDLHYDELIDVDPDLDRLDTNARLKRKKNPHAIDNLIKKLLLELHNFYLLDQATSGKTGDRFKYKINSELAAHLDKIKNERFKKLLLEDDIPQNVVKAGINPAKEHPSLSLKDRDTKAKSVNLYKYQDLMDEKLKPRFGVKLDPKNCINNLIAKLDEFFEDDSFSNNYYKFRMIGMLRRDLRFISVLKSATPDVREMFYDKENEIIRKLTDKTTELHPEKIRDLSIEIEKYIAAIISKPFKGEYLMDFTKIIATLDYLRSKGMMSSEENYRNLIKAIKDKDLKLKQREQDRKYLLEKKPENYTKAMDKPLFGRSYADQLKEFKLDPQDEQDCELYLDLLLNPAIYGDEGKKLLESYLLGRDFDDMWKSSKLYDVLLLKLQKMPQPDSVTTPYYNKYAIPLILQRIKATIKYPSDFIEINKNLPDILIALFYRTKDSDQGSFNAFHSILNQITTLPQRMKEDKKYTDDSIKNTLLNVYKMLNVLYDIQSQEGFRFNAIFSLESLLANVNNLVEFAERNQNFLSNENDHIKKICKVFQNIFITLANKSSSELNVSSVNYTLQSFEKYLMLVKRNRINMQEGALLAQGKNIRDNLVTMFSKMDYKHNSNVRDMINNIDKAIHLVWPQLYSVGTMLQEHEARPVTAGSPRSVRSTSVTSSGSQRSVVSSDSHSVSREADVLIQGGVNLRRSSSPGSGFSELKPISPKSRPISRAIPVGGAEVPLELDLTKVPLALRLSQVSANFASVDAYHPTNPTASLRLQPKDPRPNRVSASGTSVVQSPPARRLSRKSLQLLTGSSNNSRSSTEQSVERWVKESASQPRKTIREVAMTGQPTTKEFAMTGQPTSKSGSRKLVSITPEEVANKIAESYHEITIKKDQAGNVTLSYKNIPHLKLISQDGKLDFEFLPRCNPIKQSQMFVAGLNGILEFCKNNRLLINLQLENFNLHSGSHYNPATDSLKRNMEYYLENECKQSKSFKDNLVGKDKVMDSFVLKGTTEDTDMIKFIRHNLTKSDRPAARRAPHDAGGGTLSPVRRSSGFTR